MATNTIRQSIVRVARGVRDRSRRLAYDVALGADGGCCEPSADRRRSNVAEKYVDR